MKKKPRKSRAISNDDFLRLAYCALVLRGYSKPGEIADPILVEVWKRGLKVLRASEPQDPTTEGREP